MVKKSYEARINIKADAQKVWAILADAQSYTSWNSTVSKVEGTIEQGNKIKVWATVSPDRAFPVKVSSLRPPEQMVWTGGMPLGLFKGERVFRITSISGGVEFSMEEEFTGLMSTLICKSMPDLQSSFDAFAADLKKAAEG